MASQGPASPWAPWRGPVSGHSCGGSAGLSPASSARHRVLSRGRCPRRAPNARPGRGPPDPWHARLREQPRRQRRPHLVGQRRRRPGRHQGPQARGRLREPGGRHHLGCRRPAARDPGRRGGLEGDVRRWRRCGQRHADGRRRLRSALWPPRQRHLQDRRRRGLRRGRDGRRTRRYGHGRLPRREAPRRLHRGSTGRGGGLRASFDDSERPPGHHRAAVPAREWHR